MEKTGILIWSDPLILGNIRDTKKAMAVRSTLIMQATLDLVAGTLAGCLLILAMILEGWPT